MTVVLLFTTNVAEPCVQALEAAAVGAGDRPVQLQDARAIQSAESRATGMHAVLPGGLSATAQSAADLNRRGDEVTTLADVLVVRE